MNPYITGFPTIPDVFAGRTKEIKKFENALQQTYESKPSSPQNIAVVGNWGIGKTSFLNKCLAIAKAKKALLIKVTLSPEKCKTMEDFVANTLEAFYQAIWDYDGISTKIKSQFSSWKIEGFQLLGVEIKKVDKKVPTASTVLTAKIKELWKIVQNNIPAIVIAYDDLQYLSKCYANGLYDLRAIFQDTREDQVRSMLIVTGDDSLFSNIRGLSEPLLRFFEQIHLDSFSLEEAKEALYLPLQVNKIQLMYEKKVVEAIFEKTQRHPYFLNFFAHDLFEYKSKGKVTFKLFQQVYPEILEHIAAARFISDIAITSELERELLCYFCKNEILQVKEIKGITNPPMILKRLEDKGILTKVQRGAYKLYHSLFREYLLLLFEKQSSKFDFSSLF